MTHLLLPAQARAIYRLAIAYFAEPAKALARFLVTRAQFGALAAPRTWRTERAGLDSRADTRNPRPLALSGTFEGRRYVIDADTEHEAKMREVNHFYWAATGLEMPNDVH